MTSKSPPGSNTDYDDSESETENEEIEGAFDEHPLYEDSPVSVGDSLLLILCFVMRHSLTGVCLVDLLSLISMHCRKLKNRSIKSLYLFKKHFSNIKCPVKFHYFCSACYCKLERKNSVCTNTEYHSPAGVSYFIEIPLIAQLQTPFARDGFVNDLQHRFHRCKVHPDNIEDIYDAELYKEYYNKGFLSEKFNLSLMWNSDGVPIFKSSKLSLWPVFFAINELLFKKPMQKENMLVGGLWFGQKPVGNLLIEPFVESLKELYHGIQVQIPQPDQPVKVRGILLCGTCDLPAKCMFTGHIQFSGAFGCQMCKAKGESFSYGDKKKVWVYKYEKDFDLKTHGEMVQFGREAHLLKTVQGVNDPNVFGVKEPCVLSNVMPDIVRGFGIDVMHSVFLGTGKKLLELWLNPKFRKEPFSLSKYVKVVDKKLSKVCQPNFVQRGVRSISEHMAHWKASEYKNWVFYYSLPVLIGILPDKYLQHYMDFVSAVYRLCSNSISWADLNSCQECLDKFVRNFQSYYGLQHMSINIHLLLHLTMTVKSLGPLWVYSCFPFENLNGQMLKMVHGTTHVEVQLASCAYIALNLPHQIKSIVSKDVKDWCSATLHASSHLKRGEDIDVDIFTVRAYKLVENVTGVVREGFLAAGKRVVKCQAFCKLKKGNLLYVSQCFRANMKTASYYVSYKNHGQDGYGIIHSFMRMSACQCNKICLCKPADFSAIVETGNVHPYCSVLPGSKHVTFIQRFVSEKKYLAVDVHNLMCMYFSVQGKKEVFLCKPVNFIEFE